MKTHSTPTTSISIREDAVALLKAIQAMDTPCQASLLQERLTRPSTDKPATAMVSDFSAKIFARFVQCLLAKGFLSSSDGLIELSTKGTAFLLMPTSLRITSKDLLEDPIDLWLMSELRQIRIILSTNESRPPYFIFKDVSLLRIVLRKPASVTELATLPGFGAYKVNQYGLPILQAVRRANEQRETRWQDLLRKRAGWPSLQAVKTLFESGANLEEIAQKRQVLPDTAQKMLETLHYAGEINLLPWIERTLDAKELQRGIAYFQAVENPRMKEAYERLNLTYETLRMCRLYVAGVTTHADAFKHAS